MTQRRLTRSRTRHRRSQTKKKKSLPTPIWTEALVTQCNPHDRSGVSQKERISTSGGQEESRSSPKTLCSLKNKQKNTIVFFTQNILMINMNALQTWRLQLLSWENGLTFLFQNAFVPLRLSSVHVGILSHSKPLVRTVHVLHLCETLELLC